MESSKETEFEAFYRQHERRVLRLAYGVIGDRELARDAAQEAWLRYLRYIEGPQPEYSQQLLVTVALNASRDWQRRRRRRPEELHADVEPASAGGQWEMGDTALVDAVRRLPETEREAIVLHYALDLPLSEIGRILQKRTGAVKSVLHRAREKLRSELSAEEGISHGR